jgi:phospholipase C
MSKCTRWVDVGVIECKAWANEISATCTNWADEGSAQCKQWADQGSQQCSKWADEGYKDCCDWWPCSWACKAWVWVSKWVCKAWYWVAKWVCVAWYWVAKWVCKAWMWLVKAVCTIWSWAARFVCVAWGNVLCWVNALLAPLRRAARPPRIKKVFVLMLENRSFDHMLAFSGVRGRDAVTGLPTTIIAARQDTHSNVDPANPGVPVFVGTPADFKIPPDDKDPGHDFCDTLRQLCGTDAKYPDPITGSYPANIDNSGFVANYRERESAHPENALKCYPPDRVPILTTLAREFAVCDQWFSSMPGPTWPNRFFVHAASSGGLDDSPSGFEVASSSLIDGYRFENGTIFDSLDSSCIDWEIFEGDEFPQVFAIVGMSLNALEGRFTDMEEFEDALSDPDYKPSYVFIEPSYGNILPTTSEDYTCGTSQHPLDDITRGERLIKQVYEAIRNSPHWESSALVITYDEHGGFYDHVEPPKTVAPGDGLSDEDNNHHDFDFTQLGVRVPAVVVSPRIPRGTIDHTVYDHTSVLATVERLFGLGSLTRRDARAHDFLHLFSLAAPRQNTPSVLPESARSGFVCEIDPEWEERRSEGPEAAGEPLEEASAGGGEEARPVPASFWGFMHVALRKSLTILPAGAREERKELIREFRRVRTEEQARRFIHMARLRVREYDRPWQEWRPMRMRRERADDVR